MSVHRVLVVESHPITRWGLVRLIDDQPDLSVVAETDSVADSLRLAAALRPDVVTTAVSLVDGNGLDLARELRDRFDELGIVVLTSFTEDDVLFRALETGASAFVEKRAGVLEILGAIRHAGVAASSFSASGLAAALRRQSGATASCQLSTRERQVLALLASGASVPSVAAALFISTSTAKTYVARLYDKLGVTNRAQALMTAVRLGLTVESSAASAALLVARQPMLAG